MVGCAQIAALDAVAAAAAVRAEMAAGQEGVYLYERRAPRRASFWHDLAPRAAGTFTFVVEIPKE